MVSSEERFELAIRKFDETNGQDPKKVILEGKEWASEVLYAERMTSCLLSFHPQASEALQLAVRCQHICRWEIPRSSYPEGKKGYYAWRNYLKAFHGEKAAGILKEVGYEEALITQVQELLSKKHLRHDADTQCLEDVICLVFLTYYLEEFSQKHDEEKLIDILQKTWRKMSDKGHIYALQLDFPPKLSQLVSKAVSN